MEATPMELSGQLAGSLSPTCVSYIGLVVGVGDN